MLYLLNYLILTCVISHFFTFRVPDILQLEPEAEWGRKKPCPGSSF